MAQGLVVPTRHQLATLSVSLMRDYAPRFQASNMDLVIGASVSLSSRGLGLEINGDWYSFKAARWSFIRRRWVPINGLSELEAVVRDFLETKLLAGPTE
jgi:hypothetical protein